MESKPQKNLIFLELNEINFDVVELYLAADATRFPALRKLLGGPQIQTSCEQRYEELEPWIQWVSIHTCKTYAEHGVFRLGDILYSKVPQIFEQLEAADLRVGAICPMNAENRLNHPAYFIPDPWTQTQADNSWWSRALARAISQAVNDNAHDSVTPKSFLVIILGLVRFSKVSRYLRYLSLLLGSHRKPWLKALVLDLLLHDVHWSMFNAKRPDFSTLFLNAGAHIQHHYFFNAEPLKGDSAIKNPSWYLPEGVDPLADVLDLYDFIVGEYFERTDTEVILATGLAQKPYDRLKFYYRLKSHGDFLSKLGIEFKGIWPRMTRDFLISFDGVQQAQHAHNVLASVQVVGDIEPLFGEISNRGDSLFVTLTYPNEITGSTLYQVGDKRELLLPEVSFVAIKNGMHQEKGFAFFTPGVAKYAPANRAHIANLGEAIKKYFGVIH